MGELLYGTLWIDKKHQTEVLDYIRNFDCTNESNPDGSWFDFNKVVPEPAEFPPVPKGEEWYWSRQAHWRFHNWGVFRNAWETRYCVCRKPESEFVGHIGVNFITVNGSPYFVMLVLSKKFPEAVLTLNTMFEAGGSHDSMSETFVNGQCVSTTYDDQPDEDELEKALRGAPLTWADTREELKRFPVEPVEYSPEEIVNFLNEQS